MEKRRNGKCCCLDITRTTKKKQDIKREKRGGQKLAVRLSGREQRGRVHKQKGNAGEPRDKKVRRVFGKRQVGWENANQKQAQEGECGKVVKGGVTNEDA